MIIPPRGAFAALREGGAGSGNHGHAGRKGEVGGSAAADAAAKTVAGSRKFGSTVALNGTVPPTGYVVAGVRNDAGEKNEKQFDHTVTRDQVLQYIKDNAGELSKPNRFLGSWSSEGKVYLDTPEVHQDRVHALQLGHDRDEIALWDLGAQKEVFTMSDKKRPSESSGTRVRESQSDAQTHKKSSYIIHGNDQSAEQKADTIMAQIDAARRS